MTQFSRAASAVIDSLEWQALNLRNEFRQFAQADWVNDARWYLNGNVSNEAYMAIKRFKLIQWDTEKQRYTRTKLGIELSQLYS